MELKSEDIQELLVRLGELKKEVVSLKVRLDELRKNDTKVYNGIDFAITNSRLKPNNILYTLKRI